MASRYLQTKTLEEIRTEINEFRGLNLKELSIKQIKSKIHYIILGHLRIPYKLNPEGLIRGRKNINLKTFGTKKELWYPNWDELPKEIQQLNRCSDLGEKIFYSSSETDTVICELQLESGDIFTIADFSPKTPNLEAIIRLLGLMNYRNLKKSLRNYFKIITQN